MSVAPENVNLIPGLVAGADLRTKQYYAVKVSADFTVVLAGSEENAIGILQNKPNTGQPAQVSGIGSVSKFSAGAAVVAGARVVSAADGQIITNAAAAGDTAKTIGTCLFGAANADEIGSVYQENDTSQTED